ncbi:MAG: cation acetate symporter [Planctomycetota bacterium]|nr:cation acetate symporter [Planctomycetota bacterium]
MIYEPSWTALVIFAAFVGVTLGISFYLGSKAKSAQGFFTAHGQIPWFVNGIAFAGDYLSAASFLGICGMIAFYGYDGFLYSIGYLAGWVVALFVIAEPMKRLGKFTFADALDAKFQSPGIKLAAGISTLAVSIFYLIPQMVGAGVLVKPLLGLDHWVGVVLVGTTVILIVVTAGMVSTTWVQFLKGSLLVLFSLILVVLLLQRGFHVGKGGEDGYEFLAVGPAATDTVLDELHKAAGWEKAELLPEEGPWKDKPFVRVRKSAGAPVTVFHKSSATAGQTLLTETQTVGKHPDGKVFSINGLPKGKKEGEAVLHPVGHVSKLPDGVESSGPQGPLEFLKTLQNSEVVLWDNQTIVEEDKTKTTVYFQKPTSGARVLRPGEHPTFRGIRSAKIVDRVNFLSLMLALFCGTASLPHILIRYYTVKDETSARKSTIVGIASIGFFYVLTLFLGLGAMTSGTLDVTDSNMAAPLLARGMNELLFAAISGIAFTTVLGTVSGLILASAGAVTHDLVGHVFKIELNDVEKVRIARIASVIVGAIAIGLGIKFEGMNVSYLVGWAFSVAASANLPALVTLLFWKGVTRKGVVASVVVGMFSSLAWILASGETYSAIYGLPADQAIVPFSQPGIVTIPLSFAVLIVVSLVTAKEPRKDV